MLPEASSSLFIRPSHRILNLHSIVLNSCCFKNLSNTQLNRSIKKNESESIQSDSVTKLRKTKRNSFNSVKNRELREYVGQMLPEVFNSSISKEILDSKYITMKKSAQASLYLIDPKVGEKIGQIVQEHNESLPVNGTVIEVNSGFGTLTKVLKNQLGFRNINCFEDNSVLRKYLKEQMNVNVIPFNYINLPLMYNADKRDGEGRVTSLFNSLQRGTDPALTIFGGTCTHSFINFTVRTFVTQRCIFDENFPLENIRFYFGFSFKTKSIMTSNPNSLFTLYRPISILFQILFDFKILCELPRKAFIPWEFRNSLLDLEDSPQKYRKLRIIYDPDKMFLLTFKPNMKVINSIGKDKLPSLWYFIRHNLRSRKNPIIPTLEQWIPGCGPRLIRKGYTIYTQFGSLTPEEILDLYRDFISWPEYESSIFVAAVEKFHSKMETCDEDVMDFVKIN